MRPSRLVRHLVACAGAVTLAIGAAPASPALAAPLRDDPGTGAARAAITRLAPRLADRFVLRHEDAGSSADAFTVSASGGRIVLSGSSDVALVSAFDSYLQTTAHGQIARGPDNIPRSAPLPATAVHESSPYTYRYIYNFTVGGYTSGYWNWPRWEREIDELAARGVNAALVTVGQEAVWYDTFQDFGYSGQEIRDWIEPPAHQPWQWLGNIHSLGGGESKSLLERRAALGRKVIDRMRELGITPIVPGFSGMVPPGFADRNPGAHVIPQGTWNGAPRPDWLDTSSDLYQRVAADYYRHQKERFGPLHAWAVDLLHEGGATGDVSLAAAAQGVQRGLAAADPDYLWVIQAWQGNPRKELVDAIDADHLLVLDLTHQNWQGTDAFSGAPWAWGDLANFGGRLGLFGHLPQLANALPAALSSPDRGRLVGLAMVDEGVEQNPIVEQLASDMVWRSDPVNLDDWVAGYVQARYGTADPDAVAAWRILADTAFSSNDPRTADSLLNAKPDLSATTSAPRSPGRLPYDPAQVEQAFRLLLRASGRLGGVDTYRYDLVDVARQVVVNRARTLLPQVKAAYEAGDQDAFARTSKAFLHLSDLEESVLSTRQEFLFGRWQADALAWADGPAESRQLDRDAREILTIWASLPSMFGPVSDYANRDWSGLVGGYYKDRWERYFASLSTSLRTGQPPASIDWYAVGKAFVDGHERYPATPTGDSVRAARAVAHELLG